MLENITWKTYSMAVAAAVCLYYAFYLLYIYRRKIKTMALGGQVESGPEEYPEGGFDELEKLTEEIRHSILEEAGTNASKAELIVQFRHILANYDGLRQPAFRVALTNFLIQKSESICAIAFTSEELDREWDSLLKK